MSAAASSHKATRRAGSPEIRVGTSGWVYRHWKGLFYPEDLPGPKWFEFYARHFDTVEINNTFYRLPGAQVFKNWAKKAPPGFLYAVKASRYMTHLKRLKDARAPLRLFLSRARLLGEHLGPILYQLPPRWKKNTERLAAFVKLLPGIATAGAPAEILHAFEFRDPSWFDEEVLELLDNAGCAFCVHDMPGEPSPRWVSGRFVYVRFHGTTGKYAGAYGGSLLRPWATWLKDRLGEGRPVYAYFNNDVGGHALRDAASLREKLRNL